MIKPFELVVNNFLYAKRKTSFYARLLSQLYRLRVANRDSPAYIFNLQSYKLRNNSIYSKHNKYISILTHIRKGNILEIDFSSPFQVILADILLNGNCFFPRICFSSVPPDQLFSYLPTCSLLKISWDVTIRRVKELSFFFFSSKKIVSNELTDAQLILLRNMQTTVLIRRFLEKLLFLRSNVSIAVSQKGYYDALLIDITISMSNNLYLLENTFDQRILCFNSKSSHQFTHRYNPISMLNALKLIIPKHNFTIAESQLDERSKGEYHTLGYMKTNLMRSSFQLNSSNTLKPHVIIALHCFLDAPNGLNLNQSESIFVDYFHHAYCLIQEVFNADLDVIIKPHPNNARYNESHLLDSIKNLCEYLNGKNTGSSCTLIDSQVSLYDISKGCNVAALISSKGSILLESAFLKIPSYCELEIYHSLSSYKIVSKLPATKKERNDLFHSLKECPITQSELESRRSSAIKYWASRITLMSTYQRPPSVDIYSTTSNLYNSISKYDKESLSLNLLQL